MIQVGSSKIKLITENLDGKTIDGVTFKLEGKIMGLMAKFTCEGADDAKGKAIIKKMVSGLPECKTAYLKIDLLDEKGRII